MKTTFRLFIIFTILSMLCFSCKCAKSLSSTKGADNYFELTQIITDSLFNSNQIISLIKLQNNPKNKYKIEIGYKKSELKVTSYFGESENAMAAINGSFFDMDKGGSVTYLELNDSVINNTRSSKLKWGVSDSLINGAIVFNKNNNIEIQPRMPDHFYNLSKKEQAVMVTGPLLIYKVERSSLPNLEFVHKRHPRTCLCKTEESILFITVDGRSTNAQGMNLYELQDFLLAFGCKDAINLDGGGSTTMWTHDKGIVNFPSDKSGQRPVANALLIKKE